MRHAAWKAWEALVAYWRALLFPARNSDWRPRSSAGYSEPESWVGAVRVTKRGAPFPYRNLEVGEESERFGGFAIPSSARGLHDAIRELPPLEFEIRCLGINIHR